MASTIGTARGTTQDRDASSFHRNNFAQIVNGFLVCIKVATGFESNLKINISAIADASLNATTVVSLSTAIGVETVVVFTALQLVPAKPLPYSKPFTALMESIAFPKSACNLSNTAPPTLSVHFVGHT